MLKPMVKIQLF